MTAMSDNNDAGEDPKRRNWTFPIVVLAVVVGLTIVALLREPVSLDPSTPEGTVQIYLQALADSDFDAALAQTTPNIQQGCDAQDVSDNFYYDTFTATLGEVRETGTVTVVEVAINQSENIGIDAAYHEQIQLTDEDGTWKITGDPWPYFTYSCGIGQ